ncbi:MAG TPA: hypothetical protein ENN13_02000 [Candidatus Altiarchaeales archaeon]|nr:hypothetical protein [Candidatus Altiarchaeales archaeon]
MADTETMPQGGVNPDRVGIMMDVLDNIISDLNDNPGLQKIFGVPVSAGLVVVADNNDLRIEDAGKVNLTEEQQNSFLNVLDEVIRANSV